MRKFSFTLATVALILVAVGTDTSVAQGGSGVRIDKVSNQRLSGNSFKSLNGLSYQQCERLCLTDPQCMALEHIRVRDTPGGSTSQCRLFHSFGVAHASPGSDIGYKRSDVAKKNAPPPLSDSVPEVTSVPPKPEPKARSVPQKETAPPPSVPAPRNPAVDEGRRRAEAEERARRQAAEGPTKSEPGTRRLTPPPRTIQKPDGPVGSGAAVPPTEWDVAPVFFGTDRSRHDQAKRIAYGSDRGHKLEVGRALVTVPKAHQVPNVERPWAIKMPYTSIVFYQQAEDPKKHFTIQELRALSKEELLALVGDGCGVRKAIKTRPLSLSTVTTTASTMRSIAPRRSLTISNTMARRSSTAGRRALA
jgi:hypothetical protein